MHVLRDERGPWIRRYWVNTVATACADTLVDTALVLLILFQTGSIALMATMSMVVAIPNVVIGVFAAVWVDRWVPRIVISLSQIARAALMIGFVFVDKTDALWLAFVVAFAQAVVGTFDDPARARLVRDITTDETRLSVNSFTQSARMVAGVTGTSVAGFMVGTDDRFWPVFSIAGMLYLVAGSVVRTITPPIEEALEPAHEPDHQLSFATELRQGFRVIAESSTVQAVLMAISASTIGLAAATVLLTPLIVNELHIAPVWFGAIEASQSVAMITVSLLVGTIGAALSPRRLVSWGLMLTGVIIVGIAAAPNLPWLLVGMFLVGLAISPVNTGVSTLVQSDVPREKIGRVASVITMTMQVFNITAMAASGLLADRIGVRGVIAIGGIIAIGGGVIATVLFGRSSTPGTSGEMTGSGIP